MFEWKSALICGVAFVLGMHVRGKHAVAAEREKAKGIERMGVGMLQHMGINSLKDL
jgi:hypothetical protein